MGVSTFPSVASPIKSIQRGSAVSAGNITISSVVLSKTMVKSFSNGSSGTVSIAGTTANGFNGTTSAFSTSATSGSASGYAAGLGGNGSGAFGAGSTSSTTNFNGMNVNGFNFNMNAQNLVGGSTSLVSKEFGAYLSNSTTLVVTGPCRYEVIEYL